MVYFKDRNIATFHPFHCCISPCTASSESNHQTRQEKPNKNTRLYFLCVPLFDRLIHCAGLVGLSLSYALSFSNIHVFMARYYCTLSNYIVSVERIKQYMHLPAEPPAIIENSRPPFSWPTTGRIELESLKVRGG